MLEYSCGSRYQGEFKDDKTNGHGVMLYANRDKYDGSWYNGQK